MPTGPKYKVIAIGVGKTFEITTQGAPPDSQLCRFAKQKDCEFATRYWPSKKGWMLVDCRAAIRLTIGYGQARHAWKGMVREPRVYPTEDGVVMAAMLKIGCVPSAG